MSRLLALVVFALILASGCTMARIAPDEFATEDFTDSGVGCIDDCLDPAK